LDDGKVVESSDQNDALFLDFERSAPPTARLAL
jgi:hypothetical protein